jgi:hypothetical protein
LLLQLPLLVAVAAVAAAVAVLMSFDGPVDAAFVAAFNVC